MALTDAEIIASFHGHSWECDIHAIGEQIVLKSQAVKFAREIERLAVDAERERCKAILEQLRLHCILECDMQKGLIVMEVYKGIFPEMFPVAPTQGDTERSKTC